MRKSDYQNVNRAFSDYILCTWIDEIEYKYNNTVGLLCMFMCCRDQMKTRKKGQAIGPGHVKVVLTNTLFSVNLENIMINEGVSHKTTSV